MATKEAPTTTEKAPCDCGCGDAPKKGRFLPGHDARLKSALRAGLASTNAADRAKAQKRASDLGWILAPAVVKVPKVKATKADKAKT